MALQHSASHTEQPVAVGSPFKGLWRHDHPGRNRVWIMATMLVVLILLILTGLTIGETLTRLISG